MDGTNLKKDYSGKTVIITGGANGIGKGLAHAIAKRGGNLIIADILDGDASACAEELKAAGCEATSFAMDVSHEQDWADLRDFALEKYGAVDYLFNNAGIMYSKPYECFVAADWELYFHVNVMGPVFGCNTFWPVMQKQGGGHICTTVSQAALGPLDGKLIGAPYAPLKSATLTFVEQFAVMMEQRQTGVTCSAILPSIVKTEISDRMANPAARPEEFRDNPDIMNLPPEVVEVVKQTVAQLANPQTDEDRQTAFAMGVITVDQAVEAIMDGLDRGFFYIYTHPGRTAAIIRQESDLRLAGYKQPLPQSAATLEYVRLSKTNV
ncbi:MAG: SDR family NAD(P)-dependent oxidoreductase [Eggerthellaceae bacterium]|jgi:NAD(P)-dependent dehydrogenase (short-subunit alcohol dehydrogenase family)